MKNFRLWGKPPYGVVVVHGGPGARGAVAPVARELSKDRGILEPFQTKDNADDQAAELADVIEKQSAIPVVLVGHSWGAVLSSVTTARHPELVKKLILVSTVPLQVENPQTYKDTRLKRLSPAEQEEVTSILQKYQDAPPEEEKKYYKQAQAMMMKSDFYSQDGPTEDADMLEVQPDVMARVGEEMWALLAGSQYLEIHQQITCPLTVICGDYDSRPAGLVQESFARVRKDFKFILLEKCGHIPWLEKYARDKFFEILREEIA
jgi:pimeloyl-ACP methyl ester carboxylesterase